MKIASLEKPSALKLGVKSLISFQKNDGLEIGGYIAYNILLSLFPFMIFLAALTHALDASGNVLNPTNWLYRFAPDELLQIMQPVLDDILKAHQNSGIITLGIAIALWASSTGIESMRVGLNRAYAVPETRSFAKRRAQSIGMVFVASLTMIVMSLAIVIGPLLIELANAHVPMSGLYNWVWNITRYLLAFTMVVCAFVVFYRYLPNHARKLPWKHALPGAFCATLAWLAVATGFSFYLSTRGQGYSVTYGSLAGAIILMLFFHISAMIVLYGGELNAQLARPPFNHGVA